MSKWEVKQAQAQVLVEENMESLNLNGDESSDEEERPCLRSSSLRDGVLIFDDAKEFGKEEGVTCLSEYLERPAASSSSSSSSFSSCCSSVQNSDKMECSLDLNGECEAAGSRSFCKHSLYGAAKSEEEVRSMMLSEEGEGGLLWKARMVPDDFDRHFQDKAKLKILPLRDYDATNRCVKARRGIPTVTESDFLSSLVHLKDEGRWVFSGVLNGWPGLTCLELLRIEFKGQLPRWRTYWSSHDHIATNKQPSFPVRSAYQTVSDVRLVLRSPPWSAHGWARDSLGYVFWNQLAGLTYGTNILESLQQPNAQCTRVHMISHRYARGDKKESQKEKLIYHSIALLEWDHRQYCTVAEIGFLNGVSGYNGRANWYHDKDDAAGTTLYRNIKPEMVTPWKENLSEIRLHDVPVKNLEEFKLQFMDPYTGPQRRFLDVHYTFSHTVRLTFRSKLHIANYIINYIRRDRTYSEINRNCQTFAADFCAFLAGKKDLQPFHPLNRIDYKNTKHFFLYESTLYK